MFLFASKEWPPHDTHRKRPVTRSFSIHLLSNYTRAKWHKRKPCHLEKLPSKRNSNNRNTPDASCKNPCKSAEHASKYKPQNISQSSHIRISPDAIPDTTSYPLFCEQFAASIASTSNNAGISLLGLSYSMTYVSPQLRSFFMYVDDCTAGFIYIVIPSHEVTFCTPSHEIYIVFGAEQCKTFFDMSH